MNGQISKGKSTIYAAAALAMFIVLATAGFLLAIGVPTGQVANISSNSTFSGNLTLNSTTTINSTANTTISNYTSNSTIANTTINTTSLPKEIAISSLSKISPLSLPSPTAWNSMTTHATFTLSNNGAAIPAGYQQVITFNPSTYSAYESSNLGNIRFYQGSTELNSWCYSGCTSSSTSAVFWVKLANQLNNGKTAVNMSLLPSSTNFDGYYAGEAPWISSTYAQYDNGGQVFNLYFNMTSNPIAYNGTYTSSVSYNTAPGEWSVTSGTGPFGTQPLLQLTNLPYGYGTSGTTPLSLAATSPSVSALPSSLIVDAYVQLNGASSDCEATAVGTTSSSLTGYIASQQVLSGTCGGSRVLQSFASTCYLGSGSSACATGTPAPTGLGSWFTLEYLYRGSATNPTMTGYISPGTNLDISGSAYTVPFTNTAITSFSSIYLESELAKSTDSVKYALLLARAAPPGGGAVPSVSVPIILSVSIPNSILDGGQSELITSSVIGGSSPYTYSWKLNGNTLSQTTASITVHANASDIGTDSLTLTVTDANGAQAQAAGTVTIYGSVGFGSPQISIPNSALEVGQLESITANVMGGIGPYTFAWKLNGNPLQQTGQIITFNANSSDLGSDSLSVVATDSANLQGTGTGSITVYNSLSFGAPQISIPNSIIDVGQSELITANAIGGFGAYSYAWKLNGNLLGATGKTITLFGNTSDIGTDNITVIATDATLATASATGSLLVNAHIAFGSLALTLPYSILDVGQSESVGANTIGGTSPYAYAWKINGNSITQTSQSITFTANATNIGNDILGTTVTDHLGQTAIGNGIITVNPAVSIPTIVASRNAIDAGQNVTITTTWTGGTAPYVSYLFYGTSPSCAPDTILTNVTVGITHFETFTVTPPTSGAIYYCTNVTDHVNVSKVSGTVQIVVSNTLSFGTTAVTIPNSIIDIGQSETITANAMGGTIPYLFTWKLNSVTLSSTTNQVKIFGNASDLGNDSITVTVKDASNSVATAFGTVKVSNALTTGVPGLTIPNSIIDAGQSELITGNVVGGTMPYIFSWKMNGNSIFQSTNPITFNGNTSNIGNDLVTLTVTDMAGESVSANGVVTVHSALTFGSVAVKIPNSIIEVGQSETIAANVFGGTSPYTFTWYLNGNALSQSTNAITIHGNSSDLGIDSLSVMVKDAVNSNAIGSGTVQVNPALAAGSPTVTVSNGIIDVGQSELVTANVIGGITPYTYVWKINGNVIGTNSNAVTIFGNSSDIGTDIISVKVTDAMNSIVTGNGIIIVHSVFAFTAPAVYVPNSILEVGQSEYLLSRVIGGTTPYAFTWNIPGNAISTGSNSMILFNANSSDIGNDIVGVSATDSLNSVVTGSGVVDVVPAILVTRPQPITIVLDQVQNTILTATATNGVAPYSYQWLATSANGVAFSASQANTLCGASASTASCSFMTTTNTPTGIYNFELKATDSYGINSISQPSNVIVNPQLIDPITPSSPTIDSGQTLTLTETFGGGTSPFNMTWYSGYSPLYSLDTNAIASFNGLVSNSPVNLAVSPTLNTYYYVSITDSANTPVTRNSPMDMVHVSNALGATISPLNPTILSGNSITLKFNFTGGTGPFAFQWYSGSSPSCASDNAIVGANSLSLTTTPAVSTYYCVSVTDNSYIANTANSLIDLVAVNSTLSFGNLSITIPNGSIYEGQTEIVTANTVGGLPPIVFTWYLNGNVLSQTTRSITFFGNASDLGTSIISVNAIDSANAVASANAILIVTVPPTTTIPSGGGGGGPSGGGGGGGGSGGGAVPLVTPPTTVTTTVSPTTTVAPTSGGSTIGGTTSGKSTTTILANTLITSNTLAKAAPPPSSAFGGYWLWILLILLVILLILLLLLLAWRRRKKKDNEGK